MGGALSERTLLFAPNGRDASVAEQLLREAGFSSRVVTDLSDLVGHIELGAGLAIITEEALRNADLRQLQTVLHDQSPWSDFPVILLTSHGGGVERNPAATRYAEVLGNVSFIERPFHPTTLISAVRTAIRGRRRQYEARTLLDQLSVERQALSELTQTLEKRVDSRTEQLMLEVAERERTQDLLRQAQKMESIGQLTGGIAHDFNNLLMAVQGNLEILKKRVPDDERVQRLIDGALQGAKRGASLTQRLLAFARQQDLQVTSVDLASLLAGMNDLFERSLGPQISVRYNLPGDLPPANADANQIELAILNLAINARDAMANGGVIDISVAEGLPPQSETLRPGRYLCVRVADHGTGMDEATLKKAIEPFFSTKPVGKGTGLGLSMVHGLADQLGGVLDISSELGRGTAVDLWLPVAQLATEQLHEAAKEPNAQKITATILVVDDDPLISMSAIDILQDLGHSVIEASSGKQAIDILQQGAAVDMMMTDHAMPGMTGLELARAVRVLRPELPILLVTGYADIPEGETLNLPRLGKPYRQDDLEAEIIKLLAPRAA